MKKVNALVLGLSVLLAVGCDTGEKNVPGPGKNPNNAEVPARTCRLDEITSRDGADESVILLNYDQQNRISRISTKENGILSGEDTRLEYGANNKVIKVVEYANNVPGSFQSLGYNTDGLLVEKKFCKDYALGSGANNTEFYFTYAYNAKNQLVRRNRYDNPGGVLSGYFLKTYSYAADSTLTVTTEYFNVSSGTPTLTYRLESAYDKKKGAFQPLQDIFLDDEFTENNVLTEKATILNPLDVTNTVNSYEYNSDGYPTKVTSVIDGQTFTGAFKYTCQ